MKLSRKDQPIKILFRSGLFTKNLENYGKNTDVARALVNI